MNDLIEWIERFETARDDLRDVIREAHSTQKALRGVLDEVEDLRGKITKDLGDEFLDRAGPLLSKYLDSTMDALRAQMDLTARRIASQFNELETHLFVTSGGSDIRQQAREMAARSEGIDPGLPVLRSAKRTRNQKAK